MRVKNACLIFRQIVVDLQSAGSSYGRSRESSVSAGDSLYVVDGLAVGRYLVAVFDHRTLARVITCKGKIDIVIEHIEKQTHVFDAALDVLFRVVDIRDAHAFCRKWHQLHQATRAFWRDRARAV